MGFDLPHFFKSWRSDSTRENESMKIHHLSIANFRSFKQIELTFEPDVTLIAGINGVGKSAILQALATLFSQALPEFTPSAAKPFFFTDDDIHHGKPSLEISLSFTVDGQRCYGNIYRVRGSDEVEIWNRFWLNEHTSSQQHTFSEMLTRDIEADSNDFEHMLGELKAKPYQPIVIYFSPRRQLSGPPKALPGLLKPFEIANAYDSALLDREVGLQEFTNWFSVEAGGSSVHQHRRAILDKMTEAVVTLMPDFDKLILSSSQGLRFVMEKSGTPLAMNQLSDGERGLLAMVFDITCRLCIANPGLDDPITEGAGIILIDEIELHLHPKWQRQVLRRLSNTFKNCQFIVTSHSPQVIGQLHPRCLRVLEWSDEKDRIIPHTVAQSFGMDSNWVLRNIMGSLARDYETEQRLSAVYDKTDEEDISNARNLLMNIEKDIGLFPELQEAKSYIDRLEMLKNNEED